MVSNGELNVANKNYFIEFWHMSKKRLEVLARKTIILHEVTSMHLETHVDCLARKTTQSCFSAFAPKKKISATRIGAH